MTVARILLHLLVDSLSDVRRQNLHESGGGQSPHGVVLDSTARKISVGHKSKVINSPEVNR